MEKESTFNTIFYFRLKVVLLHEVANLVHLAARIEITRGVVGVADEDGSRAFIDEFFKLLHLRQREALVNRRGDGADDRTSRDGKRHVVSVGRLWHDDFVARIQTSQKRKEDCFRTSAGDDDIVGREVDVILCVVVHQLLAITAIPLRRAVFQNLAVDVLDSIQCHLRSRQVWLSDVQMIHLHTALLSVFSQWSQLADRRTRHLRASYGNFRHKSQFRVKNMQRYNLFATATNIWSKNQFLHLTNFHKHRNRTLLTA